ncbi:glucosamine-6-phosphate deaminase [Halodurantibacterium flavum]|uniref:Glucosamine-6-phosphate deaminase n=1 Tax=Halodurantibacterium flavum TaxID=1382802 RepID=A0ABW4S337_9RHOB
MQDSPFQPRLMVLPTPGDVAQKAAALIAGAVRTGRARVLGLATGRTPLGVYTILSQEMRAGTLSLAGTTTFNLDEYAGIPADHPSSYRSYMNRHLFAASDIDMARTHLPDGMAPDPVRAAADYEAMIETAGGIDLQILGIGQNGHIGFNEPGSRFDSRTRIVPLAPSTRAANAGDFPGGTVPEKAVTMGIGTILAAKKILLLASGPAKAEALAAMLEGPVTPACPASALRLHPDATVICDTAAAARLSPATRGAAPAP